MSCSGILLVAKKSHRKKQYNTAIGFVCCNAQIRVASLVKPLPDNGVNSGEVAIYLSLYQRNYRYIRNYNIQYYYRDTQDFQHIPQVVGLATPTRISTLSWPMKILQHSCIYLYSVITNFVWHACPINSRLPYRLTPALSTHTCPIDSHLPYRLTPALSTRVIYSRTNKDICGYNPWCCMKER
jgi:hypothetical protein